MLLFHRDVEAACKKHIKIYQNNCSGFVRAVANELLLLVPGISNKANGQMDWMKLINTPSFQHLGEGKMGEIHAVNWAAQGHFVICGLNSEELQANRPNRTVNHGHVAIVVGEKGNTGWPLAYWGSLGGSAGIRESLSKSFRASDRETISYFGYRVTK